jgi:UDP-2-acetamido-3-amino-2,3-dideoxy-glucuronate N-acetyltransferase
MNLAVRELMLMIHDPLSMKYNAHIAVVGSGYWGKNLVRNFHQLGALKLVCDKNDTVLEDFKKQYPNVDVCSAFTDVLGRNDIKGIAIATPAETHFNLVREALSDGKHVFVEKPLALTVEEGQQLVKLAERKQLILMVGHILHYHPAVNKLKELIDSGELGKIQYIYSNRLNIGKIRAEENILWSFAPHDISIILMFLGEMPESAYATGGCYLQHHIPDTTLTTLDFCSGVKAHIFVSWLHPFKEQKMVVVGDKKMAVFDDVGQEKLLLYSHKIQWLQRVPVAAKAEAEVVQIDMQEPLKAQCQHFLDCIARGTRPKTDGREGLRILQVLQALQQSLNNDGRKVILNQNAKTNFEIPESLPCHSQESYKPKTKRYFVHESSYVDDGVEIGNDTKIWHFSHILSGSIIGKRCNIGQNVVIGPDVTIGNGCKIQNNVSVYKGVTLEDDVFCGPSVVFTNVFNPRAHIRRMDEIRPTLIKKGTTLGANCTVVCGHTVGCHAFIGAGAVVTKSVPDYALMVGVPAHVAGWVCECGEKLHFAGERVSCMACNKRYILTNNEKVEQETE